jgi:hypothetical protein
LKILLRQWNIIDLKNITNAVMILIEKTVSSNEDNKFVITVRTRRHRWKKNCTLRREHCIYKAMKALNKGWNM